MDKLKKFFVNGFLITAVSIIMRSVAVSFNVYVSNRIGAVAMGVFTLISTVYGFSITLATSGINLAATRHIAEAVDTSADLRSPKVRCIVQKCVNYALFFSITSAILLYTLAPLIGKELLLDERTVKPLRILAFTLPPIALSSVLSGYFTAVRRVYKNALVTVVGQAIKILSSVWLITLLGANDVESACISVVSGGAIAEIGSFLLHLLLYITERNDKSLNTPSKAESRKYKQKVISTALPVALSAYARSGLISLEHMLIPRGLEKSGSTKDKALAAYGIVHSMVFPLVLFPSALSASFAGLLIPEVAESSEQKDYARIERIIRKVFFSVFVFSIGVAGIMMTFSFELSNAVYPKANAGKYVLMIAPLIPVMYVDTSVDGILKGLGEQVYCMIVNIIDALLSVILVVILLPRFGIIGYILTVYFTEIINATLSITRLFCVTRIKPDLFKWIINPLLCIITSTALTRLMLTLMKTNISSLPALVTSILMCSGIYLFLVFVIDKIKKRRSLKRHLR